jgi:hypothetical protein
MSTSFADVDVDVDVDVIAAQGLKARRAGMTFPI